MLTCRVRAGLLLVVVCTGLFVPASASSRIYFGVYAKESQPGDLSQVQAFEQDAGKRVSIVHMFQQWGAPNGLNEFHEGALDAIRRRGSIPLLTWEPWVPKRGVNQPDYALRKITAGRWDGYIGRFADGIRRWGHPMFLRFGHEMNGNWYPWSEAVNGNRRGEFAQAWRHVHDVFAAHRVTNVTWVWCPSRKQTNLARLRQLFPGERYVDWVGMDGYNGNAKAGWQSIAGVFASLYANLQAICDKPVMVAETSCVEQGGDKAQWIRRALTVGLPERLPRVRAIVWLNQRFGDKYDWRIESSPAAQRAFREAIGTPLYTTSVYDSLRESPILPP